MTNRDITQAFIRYYGLKQVKGKPMLPGEIAPLSPFLLCDMAWEYYRKTISKMEWHRELEKHRKRMQDSYERFMKRVFLPLNEDQSEYLVDKMDSLNESVTHHLDITEIAYQNCFMDTCTPEQEQVMGAILMCGNLAKLAMSCFKELYTGLVLNEYKSDLDGIRYHARMFEITYLRQNKIPDSIVPQRYADNLELASDVLLNKFALWLKNERETEYEA